MRKKSSKKERSISEWVWMKILSDNLTFCTIEDLKKWLDSNKVNYTDEELCYVLEDCQVQNKLNFQAGCIARINSKPVIAFPEISIPAHVIAQERERRS